MSTKVNLSKLERVPLREAWKHEAGDFTPWLAEADNLDALAQALGLSELEAVATEHYVGDFKLDILCTDGVGRPGRVAAERHLAGRGVAIRLVLDRRELLHRGFVGLEGDVDARDAAGHDTYVLHPGRFVEVGHDTQRVDPWRERKREAPLVVGDGKELQTWHGDLGARERSLVLAARDPPGKRGRLGAARGSPRFALFLPSALFGEGLLDAEEPRHEWDEDGREEEQPESPPR